MILGIFLMVLGITGLVLSAYYSDKRRNIKEATP